MLKAKMVAGSPAQPAVAFYQAVVRALREADVPFMVGGGYAFSFYTAIERHTKDLDIFVRPEHADWTLGTMADAGYRAEMIAPHWLGKAFSGDAFIDVVFSSGNGVAIVDDEWFEHAEQGVVFGLPVLLCPVEEMIWSKGFVLERERYDGADVTHLILARGDRLDWARLLRRFDDYWQVLLSHLILFRFAYPSHRALVPRWAMRGLLGRLQQELGSGIPDRRLCRGTLLSARQYLVDVEEWQYQDARLDPEVQMTAADVELLTSSIRAGDPSAKGHAEPRRRR